MRARKAMLPDAEAIHGLIREYSRDGEILLPRPLAEICENIRDFVVVEDGNGVFGCGALHLYGIHLAEIRSICVRSGESGRGGGRLLVKALLQEANQHGVTCVCLFTRIPEFFARMGFMVAPREALPDKMYKDCVTCPRMDACDEVAMFRGELPNFAILTPPEPELIEIKKRIRLKA